MDSELPAWTDAVSDHADGALIAVYAQPRAGRSAVVGLHDGRVKIALKAPPVDGKANQELTSFLAGVLGVPRRDVELVAGLTGRRKRVLVRGVTSSAVASSLALA